MMEPSQSKSELKREKIAKIVNMGITPPNFDNLQETSDNKIRELETIVALNYTSVVFEYFQLKNFAIHFCKNVEKDADLAKDIELYVPDWEFFHIGKVLWIINNGGYIKDVQYFVNQLKSLVEEYKTESSIYQTGIIKTRASNLRDTIRENTSTLIGELEGVIDDVVSNRKFEEPADILLRFGRVEYERVVDHFNSQIVDIELGGEGYDELDHKYKNTVLVILKAIILHLENWHQSKKSEKTEKAKITRKSNIKPKKVDPKKLVKRLRYKQEDSELGIKSINPESVLGTAVVWVFNTRYNTMTQFVAENDAGLSIKGSSIIGFSEKLSQTKKLRKPRDFIKTLLESGKVSQRNLLDGVKSKKKIVKGRMGEHSIIVKAYR